MSAPKQFRKLRLRISSFDGRSLAEIVDDNEKVVMTGELEVDLIPLEEELDGFEGSWVLPIKFVGKKFG